MIRWQGITNWILSNFTKLKPEHPKVGKLFDPSAVDEGESLSNGVLESVTPLNKVLQFNHIDKKL